MNEKTKAFLYLHISVFLFGFTAILGDLIDVNFISIVWWRSFFTALVLIFVVKIGVLAKALPFKVILKHSLIGFILAVHWLFFYGSIKISNPTMALIALASTSLITAILEPFIIKQSKWKTIDIVLGVLVIPGFYLIFYNADQMQQTGLWIGLIAALLGSFFSILNKKWLVIGHELKLTFIQITAVLLTITVFLILFSSSFDVPFEMLHGIDWFYMAIFAVFCTVIAYYLYLKAMNHINAFDVSIAFNMEPIYGIVMAALILHDHKNLSYLVYIGMIFISLIVFLNTYLKYRIAKQKIKNII